MPAAAASEEQGGQEDERGDEDAAECGSDGSAPEREPRRRTVDRRLHEAAIGPVCDLHRIGNNRAVANWKMLRRGIEPGRVCVVPRATVESRL